ncbi:MAG TPA: ferritin-like domain-containing protein [Trebonia sp.]
MTAPGTEIAALQGALAAEHAAVYGYGVVGAVLTGAGQARARTDWIAHQVARDTLETMLTRLGAVPAAASPAYQLPFAVSAAAAAQRLAAVLEDGVTRAYLGLVAVSDPALRSFAARAMQASATRSASWSGTTQAFPGLPVRAAGRG